MITRKDNIAFLIKTIYSFIQNSDVSIKNETFTNITIEINGSESILNYLKILYIKFKTINNNVTIFKNENNEIITLDDINENIEDSYIDFKWKIAFNKFNWFNYDKYNVTTFFDINTFNDYLENLNIFSQDNEFIKYDNIQIILPMCDNLFVESANYLISNKIHDNYKFNSSILLPNNEQIKEQIQVLSNKMIVFSPKSFYINESNISDNYIKTLQQNYARVLGSTLVSIFYTQDKIKIQGLKYLELSLFDNYNYNIDNLKLLENLILWLYENNTTVKLQLLADRLSIYKTNENNLLQLLDNNIKEIFSEIQDRYKFVIKEKSVDYSKDLKDILKDTKVNTDKFSQKTRLIINTLLRDILGSVFFIGLTVYSKFSTNKDFIISSDANIIFIILSIYFILSMLLQSIFNFKDINMTMDEIELGSQSSQEYINQGTYNKYVTEPLDKRNKQFKKVQWFVVAVYTILAMVTYNIQNIYQYFIPK
ncbi:MAG TPA: hypothetical protein EYG89_03770 [Bacteroidia bacterium]|nr:hypothetical protein [Bacteroidia bacterium]